MHPRSVASLRRGGRRLQDDVVEVAAQRAPRLLDRAGQRSVAARFDVRGRSERIVTAATMPGEQFAEQDAQCIDVGRCRDETVGVLFGCRVRRRQHRDAGVFDVVDVEQLGDAEVEQLDAAVAGHEHVRRFEVAMHDQRAMR
ncbi:MAG: hypothetical protein NVV68_18310 [Dokdonella sp.]|nr:hypothetical protein [Dokdonella sp.]